MRVSARRPDNEQMRKQCPGCLRHVTSAPFHSLLDRRIRDLQFDLHTSACDRNCHHPLYNVSVGRLPRKQKKHRQPRLSLSVTKLTGVSCTPSHRFRSSKLFLAPAWPIPRVRPRSLGLRWLPLSPRNGSKRVRRFGAGTSLRRKTCSVYEH